MIRFRFRRGRIEWQWFAPAWPCRIGLHFMTYSFMKDGYACTCGYQHLWNEEIRR